MIGGILGENLEILLFIYGGHVYQTMALLCVVLLFTALHGMPASTMLQESCLSVRWSDDVRLPNA